MGTAASVVSKLEAGADVKVSTLQRYCGAIGQAFPPQLRLEKGARECLRKGARRGGRRAKRSNSVAAFP